LIGKAIDQEQRETEPFASDWNIPNTPMPAIAEHKVTIQDCPGNHVVCTALQSI
jgi:hypothetical protein